ncbi:hypothetical protein MNBD_GAMMA16-1437 [hydrothermal vent metagenome]|uniref:5-bromo-4-chloroindolyl phosphate hydrolysis protein n=1 Tax=hydrothermal vent metagenome TaxID=652676 RepID=A0A3B0ZJX0_9ZZZZ
MNFSWWPQRQSKTLSVTKGLLLFILPLPILGALVISLAKGDLSGVLGNASASLLFFLGAMVMRRGLALEEDYQRNAVAVAPKVPVKMISILMIAIATGITAYYGAGQTVGISLSFAVGAFFGCYLTYGCDPRKEKNTAVNTSYSNTEEVVRVLYDSRELVAQIERANKEIHNQEMHERLRRIIERGRKILQSIEQNPRDIRRVNRFLTTYLVGTQRITEGYVKMTKQTHSDELAENFRKVLITIEDVFQEQHQKMLENDILDLDVQIEVLAIQLKQEGVS